MPLYRRLHVYKQVPQPRIKIRLSIAAALPTASAACAPLLTSNQSTLFGTIVSNCVTGGGVRDACVGTRLQENAGEPRQHGTFHERSNFLLGQTGAEGTAAVVEVDVHSRGDDAEANTAVQRGLQSSPVRRLCRLCLFKARRNIRCEERGRRQGCDFKSQMKPEAQSHCW